MAAQPAHDALLVSHLAFLLATLDNEILEWRLRLELQLDRRPSNRNRTRALDCSRFELFALFVAMVLLGAPPMMVVVVDVDTDTTDVQQAALVQTTTLVASMLVCVDVLGAFHTVDRVPL